MRTRSTWVAAILWLLSATVFAQDGLRSASLPERASDEPIATERDLFRVPPDFYTRPPDPGSSRLFFPQPLPILVAPSWYVDPYRPFRVPIDSPRLAPETRSDSAPAVSLSPASQPAPSMPGKPKTFYVIPGCYAGDRPPDVNWLPAGCDMSKLRVVPPQ
jgi:hypothetical protein